ncbi:Golgi CORVET complex core vacuolar protein 8-domain-containing protein [Emericellopsis atlantica]|uniref:Golgi CORVET complex core vacuolar protein 8-domain-containing protein n=1 Tax=Emericellopsis atlantica TaxID=2614577 RepID=A0A9P7ZQX3_9HYPO|nr:Golgi CORVET complex core vacuolar protein 8-domain-containing protein [Emericellopsis atlantica]KAG9256008.1 Golgi CORVET complex core vacuolar protein 8-domain-containing protein [Emericellopsis atlantica]
MAEPEDTPQVNDPRAESSSDSESLHGAPDHDDVPQLESHAEPAPRELTDVAVRTKSQAGAPEEGSEMGSIDMGSVEGLPRRVDSPIDSVLSGPDETPSVQGSVVSSLGSSVLPSVASRPGLGSPTPSFRPFDRRFKSRISSSGTLSPRAQSPAFLSPHSRHASLSSNFVLDQSETETSSPPWEVVRWTRLKKLNGQAFSEAGKRNFGSPTCLAVSASIVLGTSKGIILIFDYNQNLKMILGPGTKAVESGSITSVAISADHTTVAGGHANGNIFTWDTSRASRPFLTIPHLDESQAEQRTADGHVPNAAVTHLGFLGTRHTALVSADEKGMAFSHLATRGTGSLGRTVKTTRILGRYPNAPIAAGKSLKPSTVLAFSPLPLGNVERATDTMGLTAMLTPYLLVIVSTTPVAQTQHKSARPKDIQAHSPMTGCLAWFPAVKLKVPDAHTGSDVSLVKLAYCWSNVLTVLDVDEIPGEDKDQPSTLRFKARSRWKCEEAIAAVQWLSRSVIVVLTLSQRLIVLEDRSMRQTEAFDLIQKHVYHVDLFSRQLHALVEQLDEEDPTMHGVVGDAFYMSLKAYKGRIFLLGFGDVSIGALSNWADRLIAIMENGDYIAAIQLATSYYTGDADKLTVGLPEDTATRQGMVRDKIMEIMTASLKYAFNQREQSSGDADNQQMKQLAETCFIACQSVGDTDYLFDEMYEWYEEAGLEGIFLEALEPYILERTITMAPPTVLKDMVSYYVSKGWEGRLEEMICHMETATMDLDQTTLLCKQHGLYDALTYVWNQAIGDYITPMIDLLTLLIPFISNDGMAVDIGEDYFGVNALKIFPYLAYTWTGRIYPNGEPMDEESATKAKAEIYWFLFSGKTIAWPKEGGQEFLTRPRDEDQPSFPYLRLILKFDAPSLLSALNEAFEDSFLNDSTDKHINGNRMEMPEEQIFGQTINRQYVMSILLDVMNPNDFAPEDTIYLDMFVARNLPKFQQYLLFSGSTLSKVLNGLCNYPGDDLAEDAQLSAEYLLSVYRPSDMAELMPLFKRAGFYRILKRTYKSEQQYGKLIETYFEDPEEQDAVFECITSCLRKQSGLSNRQLNEVMEVVRHHARDLLEIDPERTARTLASHGHELHLTVLESADDAQELRYGFLKALLEPNSSGKEDRESPNRDLIEKYVQLMCTYEPSHVSEYVGVVQSANLRLDKLLPTMEETGVIDAAVVLMAQDGQIKEAMDRLVKHLGSLESALQGLLGGTSGRTESYMVPSATEELLVGLQNYVHVGIWLCQGQTKTSKRVNVVSKKQQQKRADMLSADEQLWLSLIDACVQITRRLSPTIAALADQADTVDEIDGDRLLALLRSLVQHTFTSLLTATSSHAGSLKPGSKLISNAASNLSFLRILRAFLTQAAAESPNLADLRGVLASIFAAYAYEESILKLSNRLLERSLYVNVQQAVQLRQRGWRPRGSTCEACGRRVWGPGVPGGAVFDAWEDKQTHDEEKRRERKARAYERAKGSSGSVVDAGGKGKGKSLAPRPSSMLLEQENPKAAEVEPEAKKEVLGPLVVLACRHVYHQVCLDAVQDRQGDGGREREYNLPLKGLIHQDELDGLMTMASISSDDDEEYLSSDHSSPSPPRQPSQNFFAPPFYGRPPTPLPPSPSLTSLLRPSRPTTPDASDDDALAAVVPRAAPKVPTYEYYGFVLYLFSSLAFLIYLLWAYLPSPFLHVLGIYYYPNRWWALAVPAFLVMTVVYIFVALALYNTEMLTLPLGDVETVVDGAGQIAVIDSQGRLMVGKNKGRGEKKVDEDGNMRWREVWSESTDAVLDVPLGGVCEVLYGEGRSDVATDGVFDLADN